MNDNDHPSIIESFHSTWSEALGIIRDTLRLAAAETRLALATMIIIAVFALIGFTLIVISIGLLELALALWLHQWGANLLAIVCVLALLNLAAAATLFWLAYRYSNYLKFEKTLNSISKRQAAQRHDPETAK